MDAFTDDVVKLMKGFLYVDNLVFVGDDRKEVEE